MTRRLAIFDLDGTLLDTLQDLADAANLALAENSLPGLPADSYRLLIGAGAQNLARRAAAAAAGIRETDVPDELTTRILNAFSHHYDDAWAVRTCPYPGIMDLLSEIRGAGLTLAILSNKPDNFTRDIADHFFPKGLFSAVFGKLEGWPIKPDPAMALEICRQTGFTPAQAVLIGDSGSDMVTAVRAGIEPIGVLWGFRSQEELLAGGARHLAAEPKELFKLLTGGDNQ